MNLDKLFKKNTDLGLLILRVSLGIMMLLHGVAKLFYGIGFIEQQIVDMGLPVFFAYGVYFGEVVAPLFLIFGVGTRLAAGVFFINCIVAVLMVHSADVFAISEHGGWAIELLGLYFFGALALIFTGGGRYALSSKYLWD